MSPNIAPIIKFSIREPPFAVLVTMFSFYVIRRLGVSVSTHVLPSVDGKSHPESQDLQYYPHWRILA